jgi:methionine aminotransferase
VIVIEPAYDSYVPSIRLAGGVPVFVSMELGEHGYSIPWDKVRASITGKTRLIMLNSPHNPTGSVLSASDIAALTDIVRDTRILIASDEVYEHMVYDGQRHESIARHPELAQRSYIISSFGKTYHVTGWKVGYVVAPAALMAEFRKVHQFNVFTVNTPMQVGLAQYMQNPAPYLELPAFYQRKRDLFRDGLATFPLPLAAVCGYVFSKCGLQRDFRFTGTRFCALADQRNRRCGNSRIGLLSAGKRIRRRALLFCQTGRDTGNCDRQTGCAVSLNNNGRSAARSRRHCSPA